jgi:hypothetical protein
LVPTILCQLCPYHACCCCACSSLLLQVQAAHAREIDCLITQSIVMSSAQTIACCACSSLLPQLKATHVTDIHCLMATHSVVSSAPTMPAAAAPAPDAGESHPRDRDRLQPGSSRRVDRTGAAASSGSCHGGPAWHEHPRPGWGPHAGLWGSAGISKHVSAAGCAGYGWWHPGIEPAAGLPTTAIMHYGRLGAGQ